MQELKQYPEPKEINEHIIKVSSSACVLEKPLDRNKRYLIQMEIDIKDVQTPDKQDGTYDIVYKAKGIGLIAIQSEKEKPFIAVSQAKMSPSQLTRFAVEQYHQQHFGEPGYEFINKDPEEFYESFQKRLRWALEKIIRLLFKINL